MEETQNQQDSRAGTLRKPGRTLVAFDPHGSSIVGLWQLVTANGTHMSSMRTPALFFWAAATAAAAAAAVPARAVFVPTRPRRTDGAKRSASGGEKEARYFLKANWIGHYRGEKWKDFGYKSVDTSPCALSLAKKEKDVKDVIDNKYIIKKKKKKKKRPS